MAEGMASPDGAPPSSPGAPASLALPDEDPNAPYEAPDDEPEEPPDGEPDDEPDESDPDAPDDPPESAVEAPLDRVELASQAAIEAPRRALAKSAKRPTRRCRILKEISSAIRLALPLKTECPLVTRLAHEERVFATRTAPIENVLSGHRFRGGPSPGSYAIG
jgi:hypothetical protein